jgi:uncharacterized membrane protein
VADDQQRSFDPVAGGHVRHRDEAEVEFNRIVAFSDGVFSIAITLLVLGLLIPGGISDLSQALLNQRDDLFAYAITFAVIGKLWIGHHRFFATLERFDGNLMGLNLLYLAFLVLLPFSSQVLGDYGSHTEAVVLYAVNLVLISLAFQAQITYAYRRDLVRPEASAAERRLAGPANFMVPLVFALSIPVAFVSTDAATVMWVLVFFTGKRLEDWVAELGRRRAGNHP